jgi:SNF2 family DNA or RNA helicase
MGIGKTLQSIASFSVWKSQGLANRALVVSISAVKHGWGKEIKKHSNFSYTILPNGKKNILEAIEAYKRNPTDFLIVHYEGLAFKRDPKKKFGPDPKSEVVEALCTCPFDVLFVDEAHLLKNMETIRYKTLVALLVGMQTTLPEMVEVELETESGARMRRFVSRDLKPAIGVEVDVL